jgi:hypothetical protein
MPPATGSKPAVEPKAPVIAVSARKAKAKGRPTVFAESAPAPRLPEAVPLTEERPVIRSPYHPRDPAPR